MLATICKGYIHLLNFWKGIYMHYFREIIQYVHVNDTYDKVMDSPVTSELWILNHYQRCL